MTSTKSSPERSKGFCAAFRWHWHKNRVITGLYTLLLLVALPVNFYLTLSSRTSTVFYTLDVIGEEAVSITDLSRNMAQSFVWSVTLFGVALTSLAAIILAVSSFGYLHNRRAVDLFNALPIRRWAMVTGAITANLLSLTLPLVLSGGIVVLLGLFYAQLVYPFSGLLVAQALGIALAAAVLLYLIVTFMGLICGTILDAFLCGGILFAGWPMLLLCVVSLCEITLPGYNDNWSYHLYLAFLPFAEALSVLAEYEASYWNYLGTFSGPHGISPKALPFQMDPVVLVWWCVLAVVLLVAILVVFILRKSEDAESSNTFPVPRFLLRLLANVTGGAGLGLVFLAILEKWGVFFVGMALGCFLTHLIIEAVWSRGLKDLKQSLPAMFVSLGILLAGSLTICFDLTGYVTRVPDPALVASASLDHMMSDAGTDQQRFWRMAEDDSLHVVTLNNDGDEEHTLLPHTLLEKDSLKVLADYHTEAVSTFHPPYLPGEASSVPSDDTEWLSVTYTMADGSTLSRNLRVSRTAGLEEKATALCALPEYQLYQYLPTISGAAIDNINRDTSLDYTWFEQFGEDMDVVFKDADAELETGYYTRSELTAEQKEQIWSTLLEEVNAEGFHYDPDVDRQKYAFEVAEDTPDTVEPRTITTYSIELHEIPLSELSDELAARIKVLLEGQRYTSIKGLGGYVSVYVPESCPKTRELIDQLLAEQYPEMRNS